MHKMQNQISYFFFATGSTTWIVLFTVATQIFKQVKQFRNIWVNERRIVHTNLSAKAIKFIQNEKWNGCGMYPNVHP